MGESDALRYEWPSVALNWERGLLAFTRSRLVSKALYPGGEFKLLNDVLDDSNTSVIILHGTKDIVIPLSMSKKLVERFKDKNISLVQFEGASHNPFEEASDKFVNEVEKLIGT